MKLLPTSLLVSLGALLLGFAPSPAASLAVSHFIITAPARNAAWVDGGNNLLQWTYAKEGVVYFDVELIRLSGTGILFVARNVPIELGHTILDVEGIPEGDDYFVVFIDSYDGQVYTRSDMFSIRNRNPPATNTAPLTITITGAPHPTRVFETTLPVTGTATLRTNAAVVVSSATPALAGLGLTTALVGSVVALCLAGWAA